MERLLRTLSGGRRKALFGAGLAYWTAVLVLLMAESGLIAGNKGPMYRWRAGEFLGLTLLAALGAAFWFWRFARRGKKTGKKKQRITVWHFLLLLCLSIFSFLEIERINNPLLEKMEPAYMALNVLFLFIFLNAVLFLLNSWKRTVLLWTAFFFVLSLVFYFVYLFRGEPFQFIDLFSVGTAMEVAGGYEFSFTREMAVYGTVSLCLLGIFSGMEERCVNFRLRWKITARAVTVGCLGLLYVCYLNTGWNGGLGILTDLYRPYQTYQEYGTTVGFLCVAKYMRLTPPEGYSVRQAEKLAEAVETDPGEREGLVKPVNIICIMNESWADYRYLGDFAVNEPFMPYYDSMKENTIKGQTLVCIQGGGTAKTEYEFLTGNSVKRFPSMVPYVSYFTHEQYSLVSTLKAQGYTAEAMHPNKGSNWKRTGAYRLLQFDRFFTIDDFDASDQRIRAYISDRANYEKIIERIESKENSSDPYFIFDVTMQNHGGYTSQNYEGEIRTEGFNNAAVNQYLSLVKESDEALEYLIEYFKKCEEPTMIVMFGDHYPSLPDSFAEWITGKTYEESTLAEQERYFATPFFIWANYDIPEAEGILTSTNYLSTMLLEQTGLAMAPYNEYLSDLRKKMPALNHLGYMDGEGEFTAWEEAGEEYERLELEYEALQYNELAEDARRLDWFFEAESGENP